VAVFAAPLARRCGAAAAALGAYLLAAVVLFGRFVYWHGEWGWGPRYVAPFYVAAAPLAWWLWDRPWRRPPLARAALMAALVLLVAVQAVPVVGYPLDSYQTWTVGPLARSGRLATSPITRPPVPADNGILYFRVENSPVVSLARTFPELLRNPGMGPHIRAHLGRALLVPLLALLLVLVAAAPGRGGGDPPPASEGDR
jgi:hypothetical protein